MRRGLLLATAWLMLTTTTATGQNLVVNGDFDVGIDGWTVGGDPDLGTPGDPASVAFRPGIDGLDNPNSGSVQIDSPSEFTLVGQCIPMPPPHTSLTARALQRGDDNSLLNVYFFSDTDCTTLLGASGSGGGGFPSFQCRGPNLPLDTQIPSDTNSVFFSFGRAVGGNGQNIFDRAFLIRGLPEDYLPHTGQADLLDVTGLTVRVRGTTEGGISPFERRFRWEFVEAGGGVPVIVEGQEVEHTFASAGTYYIFMQADSGCDESVNDMIEVTVSGSATEIPTVSSIGLAILAAILGLGGMTLLRSRLLFPSS